MAKLASYTKDPDAKLPYTIRWGAVAWAGSTAYTPQTYVYDPADGKVYECVTAHTSQTARSDDRTKWKEVKTGLFLPSGYVISTSAWVVESGDVTLDSDTEDNYSASVRVLGGTAGTKSTVRNRITATKDGEPTIEDDRTIQISIKEK